MHLSLIIDRNEENHSRYLSLSLNMKRGEYDPILTWPFDYQMAFSLFNRDLGENHFLISFQSDRTSASFQRPHSELNDAFCIPNFVPLTALEQTDSPYIAGDSIFIKMLILKDPVSIDLLPSLMDIGLSLPVEIQKAQIQQKSQKGMERSICELERSVKRPSNREFDGWHADIVLFFFFLFDQDKIISSYLSHPHHVDDKRKQKHAGKGQECNLSSILLRTRTLCAR